MSEMTENWHGILKKAPEFDIFTNNCSSLVQMGWSPILGQAIVWAQLTQQAQQSFRGQQSRCPCSVEVGFADVFVPSCSSRWRQPGVGWHASRWPELHRPSSWKGWQTMSGQSICSGLKMEGCWLSSENCWLEQVLICDSSEQRYQSWIRKGRWGRQTEHECKSSHGILAMCHRWAMPNSWSSLKQRALRKYAWWHMWKKLNFTRFDWGHKQQKKIRKWQRKALQELIWTASRGSTGRILLAVKREENRGVNHITK